TYGPEANATIIPVFTPSNRTSFMMFSAIACALPGTLTIDGTGKLRFLPSNPNRPSPDDVFGNRVGRTPFHWQCEDRTRSAASRHRLDDDLPHPSDMNEHDPDPRGSPKTESSVRSQ